VLHWKVRPASILVLVALSALLGYFGFEDFGLYW
jgi:hypothetical protein